MRNGSSPLRLAPLSIAIALAACSPHFPTGDLGQLLQNRDAMIPIASPASFMVYGGYGSPCAHPGVHFIPSVASPVYAAVDGIVAAVAPCTIVGADDAFSIRLLVANSGKVPVYLEYSVEPNGGKVCSSASGDEGFFKTDILVSEGEKVSKGDIVANLVPLGTNALLHLNLKVDGALACPEIFPAAELPNLQSTTCGPTEIIPAGTVCQDLTPSENPANL